MLGRLAIRNLDTAVLEALAKVAARHERSAEAEARIAIRDWVDRNVVVDAQERSRRTIVAERLNRLLGAINALQRSRAVLPSHLAQEIGETHAEPAESWFAGEVEPSFAQLEAIAAFLGASPAWLVHGDGKPFLVEGGRIPDDAIRWFLLPAPLNEQMRTVEHVRFVRADNIDGNLAIIREFENHRCHTLITPYHISDQVGAGGRGDLADLSNVFCLLYAIYTRKAGSCPPVSSYIVPVAKFDRLISGNTHPLAELDNVVKSMWWEDWWDPKMFQKQDKADSYWPGWKAWAEMVYGEVERLEWRKSQRAAILAGEHPSFGIELPNRIS